jgi:DNA repair photolyase
VTHEIEAKTILRKHKKIDSWFLSRYGMNLYRGCSHNCVYCDGRSESYYVDGEFGTDVSVKINAVDVLRRELDSQRKRTSLLPGYVMLGGGVGDSYQPAEENYGITRRTLALLAEKKLPVHVLTKSTLVKRDRDLLQKINEKSRVILSMSFSSTDATLSRIFEPGVPSPQERLETLTFFKDQGFACGMYLMPIIPYITDTKEILHKTIRDAKEAGVDFIICSGMTLKEGKQKDYFFHCLQKHYPSLLLEYQMIYKGNTWGQATAEYTTQLNQTFHLLMNLYKIPTRIPPELFKDIVTENDRVIVILEHLDYLYKLEGKKSPFGFAAYSVSQLPVPLSSMRYQLQRIKGVGGTTEKIIQEILNTGSSAYYERLLKGD